MRNYKLLQTMSATIVIAQKPLICKPFRAFSCVFRSYFHVIFREFFPIQITGIFRQDPAVSCLKNIIPAAGRRPIGPREHEKAA